MAMAGGEAILVLKGTWGSQTLPLPVESQTFSRFLSAGVSPAKRPARLLAGFGPSGAQSAPTFLAVGHNIER